MENYTIGSIADLISQDKGIKTSSKKKRKLVIKESKTEKASYEEPAAKNDENPTKPRKKKKYTLNEWNSNPESKRRKLDIDELDLDHVPTDSEDEESPKPVFKSKKNKPQEKFKYQDFTENTVFLGNLPITFDKKKILKVFSKFGKIETARIRCVPVADINMSKKVAAIKKKFNANRNSLTGYVKFKSKDSVEAALKANGMIIDGHHVRIDLAQESKERDYNKAVFVGGLPFNIEDDDLWDFFQNCGKINSVRVVRDSATSIGKGIGYVNFDSTAAVELALQLDRQELKNRQINVKRCLNPKNKNKMNKFSKKQKKEMGNQILPKKIKKLKKEKKKLKKENKTASTDFQGRHANVKQKKKKKLSKVALQKKKLIKILGGPTK